MPTALITGASRGIGLEFARQLAGKGWIVHACARERAAFHSIDRVIWHQLDVTDHAAVDAMALSLQNMPIDLLLNNAGVGPREGGALGTIDYALWRRVLEINAIAPVKMIEAFVEHVAMSRRKLVVSISSELGTGHNIDSHGLGGSGPWIHYRSSKAALNIAQHSIDAALAERGIVSLLLHPGWVATNLGGPHAALTAEKSVAALLPIIENADASMHGQFVGYDGKQRGW